MGKNALIGYTGFVGSNLCKQHEFQYLFNSKNIDTICDQGFDLAVCAGISAVKWLANKEPEKDLTAIESLSAKLKTISAKEFILISTVDVYPIPIDIAEDSKIDLNLCSPYGKHRRLFEIFIEDNFANTTIIRLPGLFGSGLKKNIIYDFLHNNCTSSIHQDGVFQFYNLEHLWADINIARKNKLKIINFATEPITTKEIAKECFGIDFNNNLKTKPPIYDMRTKYAELWNVTEKYLYSALKVLHELKLFTFAKKYGNK